jgi:hypothetical protein
MAEPITLRVEGDRVVIPPVEMTAQGVSRDGLPAFGAGFSAHSCRLAAVT